MGDFDVLTSDQANMLRQFQEVTNIQDEQMALATLASLDWDLARAIEAQLCNDDDDIGPMEVDDSNVIHNDQPIRRTALRELENQSRISTVENEGEDPDLPFGRLIAGGSLEESNSNQSSPHDNGSKAMESSSRRILLTASSPVSGSSSRVTRSRSRLTAQSQHDASPVAVMRSFLVDAENSDSTDNDGNDDDDTYHDAAPFGQLNEEDGKSFHDDRVPLVPSDFTSIDEALHNFVTVFEARYGGNHPPFYSGSLQDALREALEAPARPIAERRPLAVYLHNDRAVACNIFAKNVLCSGVVSSLLKGQFITWPWDITQKENRLKLFEWIDMLNVRDIRRTLEKFSDERFPLLVVIIKEKSVILPISVAWGCDGPQQVVNKLMEGLEEYQRIKNAEAAEERERIERFRMSEPLRNITIFVESKGYSLDTHRIWTSDMPMKNVVESYDLNRSLADIKWPVREQITVDEK
uniref:UAS domain-containing protein n=1 Tax=Elaeophora elaphi TaxID=1147741 RepID=A0A0R3RT25_9BILA